MTRFHVTLCPWNSPAPSTGNTGFYLSMQICGNQTLANSPDVYTRLTTEFGDWRRHVYTRHPSTTPSTWTWSNASLLIQLNWHIGKKLISKLHSLSKVQFNKQCILSKLSQLNTSKSPGPDGFHPRVLLNHDVFGLGNNVVPRPK